MKPWSRIALDAQADHFDMAKDNGTYMFDIRGFTCMIRQHNLLHLCGYVKVSIDEELSNTLNVHGGITFNDGEWIGFDCAHSGDIMPKTWEIFEGTGFNIEGETYEDLEFVYHQIDNLVTQVGGQRA